MSPYRPEEPEDIVFRPLPVLGPPAEDRPPEREEEAMAYSTKEEILAEYNKCPDQDPPMTMERLGRVIKNHIMGGAGRYIVFKLLDSSLKFHELFYKIKPEDVLPGFFGGSDEI